MEFLSVYMEVRDIKRKNLFNKTDFCHFIEEVNSINLDRQNWHVGAITGFNTREKQIFTDEKKKKKRKLFWNKIKSKQNNNNNNKKKASRLRKWLFFY